MSFPSYQEMKQKLQILILGPYTPKYALQKLETLQKCLIQKGFSQTRLVKNFSDKVIYSRDSDEHFILKSQNMIREWAHVPIFVFLKDVDNQGVTIELTYTCLILTDKQSCCATFFEGKWENFSRLIRGQVKLTKRVSFMDFENDKELCELAVGHALKMLDRLYYLLG